MSPAPSRLSAIHSHLTPYPTTTTPATCPFSSTKTSTTMSTVPAKPPVTCHILDTVLGRPAKSVRCHLHQLSSSGAAPALLVSGLTNDDGRVTVWDGPLKLEDGGVYKMVFETGEYFKGSGTETFFPIVEITFRVGSTGEHYHIPLLLAPWSYSTYRGS